MTLTFLGDIEFWKYLSIPLIAGLIGWITNLIAIRMTFYPLEFIGIPPLLGWQGIIPSKARKMAGICVDSVLSRLGTVEEIFREMEPDKIAAHLIHTIEPNLETYTEEVMRAEYPILWETLPPPIKQHLNSRIRKSLPRLVSEMMYDLSANIEQLIDLRGMVCDQMEKEKALLNRIFLECGDKELKFIIRSGGLFGGLFGLIQMVVWYLFPANWVLPLFGLLVGLVTNWVALNIIFRPVRPVKVWRWQVQGLFLKRQHAVSSVFCQIATTEILTIRSIIIGMVEGPKKEMTEAMIRRHIKPVVDESIGYIRPLAVLAMGPEKFARIRQSVGEKAIGITANAFDDPVFNRERGKLVEKLMVDRMDAMPPEAFQDLLRPCFQEDEYKLILLGGALGFLAGLTQLFLVFGIQA